MSMLSSLIFFLLREGESLRNIHLGDLDHRENSVRDSVRDEAATLVPHEEMLWEFHCVNHLEVFYKNEVSQPSP